MAALLTLRDLTHRFAGPPVLDGARLAVERGDRVCVFGRNGEGKSTLLRIVAGVMRPDAGAVDLQRGATIATLEQEVPEGEAGTVFDVVVGGLGETSERLRAFHRATARLAHDTSDAALAALSRAQEALDAVDGWGAQTRVESVLSRLGLDGDVAFATLSGGWRRRAFLAAALVRAPDVLLLDEPTNHLDIDAIEWLEGELQRWPGAVVFVTHDRAFLRAVATRFVELDRGRLREFPADFDAYVARKEHELEVESTHDALFDKRLADEERWIRTGVKARRTRNEGRVRALKALREERTQRRNRKGSVRMTLQAAERSGVEVISARDVSFSYGEAAPVVRNVSIDIKRGDCVALIGPNGAGKTTLLRLLLGELAPQQGEVEHGTKLQMGYYDQLRNELDPSKSLIETLVEKGDHVEIGGQRRHVIGYLRDFLFDDAQSRGPVSVLSGGERNRLLLARLFSKPVNVLVLDEPTNDLDMDTLEILEELLLAFEGTVLLVSHDREFVDNLVTESLVFEGDGVVTRVVGGYDAWRHIREERAAEKAAAAAAAMPAPTPRPGSTGGPARRRSRDEQRELDALPAKIEALEGALAALHAALALPETYASPGEAERLTREAADVEAKVAACYARWEALEP